MLLASLTTIDQYASYCKMHYFESSILFSGLEDSKENKDYGGAFPLKIQ
jgi:hypothetical protein